MVEVQSEDSLPVCASKGILGKKRQMPFPKGKSGVPVPLLQPLHPSKEPQQLCCPECGSSKLYKDGLRYYADGDTAQRCLCRNCQLRFTPKPRHKQYKQTSNISGRQISVILQGETKNLIPETEIKTVPGEKAQQKTPQDIKGKLVEYIWYMERQGYSPETIRTNDGSLRALLKRNANLLDPESVKEMLAKACTLDKARKPWSQNRKRNVINAYSLFLKINGLTWQKPRCNVVRKIPFIPTEAEIDQLIAGCSTRIATFLQLLKETAMRSGEAVRLRWEDVDIERRIITLNAPEKNSLPRQWEQLSPKLWDMLDALPRKDIRVFGPSTIYSLKGTFGRYRRKLAVKLQNPRLLKIHFYTLRHWKATMEYHKTKDLLHVMAFLGHKKSDNTLLYVQLDKKLFKESDDQFIIRTARNVEEAAQLAEVGFEPFDVIDGVHLYRKRK